MKNLSKPILNIDWLQPKVDESGLLIDKNKTESS